jgi:NTP pyrophosphatase (non-canonical NTP hydrolase)
MSEERREALKGELGDVLWYLAVLARDLDLDLNDIAESNVAKLKARQEKGTLKGDGDTR